MHRTTFLRRALVASAATVTAGLLLSACASGPAEAGEDGLTPVTINQAVPTIFYLPLYVAEAQGYFEDNGVDMTLDTAGSGSGAFAAVLGGSADFSIQDPVFVPKSLASGAEGVVVAGIHDQPSMFIIGTDDTDLSGNLEYLEGKKVIVSPEPDTSWAYMTYLIEQNGLENVELVNVALGSELAAVASGQADYAVAGAQSVVQGIEEQGLHQVYGFADDDMLSPFAFSSLTSTQRYLDENPEAALGVVTALEQADRFIYENPEETIQIAIEEFPDLDPEVIRFTVQSMIDTDGFPHTTLVSEEAWAHNMEVAAFIENVDAYPSESTDYATAVDTDLATRAAEAVDAE